MPSKAIKPKPDDHLLAGWESRPETAPSIVRETPATVARFLALIGLILAAIGFFATVIAPLSGRVYFIGPSLGVFALAVGLFLLVFHAVSDQDIQYRLMYLVVGYIGIGFAVVLRLLPLGGKVGAYFLPAGLPCMLLGLVFALCAIRHESDAKMRFGLSLPFGALGFLMVLLGSFAGHINAEYLLAEGVVTSVVGLVFVAAFIGVHGAASDVGYGTALGLGLIGLVGVVAALGRSYLEPDFFVPSGLLLAAIGALYLIVSLVLCTDWPVLVIYRRELKASFLSPMGFLVLLGSIAIGWIWFYIFLFSETGGLVAYTDPRVGGMPEPVVGQYLFSLILVFALTFLVPVLTMRVLSEERKSGTLEVLLTAPVSEMTLVLGKFLSALTFYLLIWLPWFGFVLALRVYGGTVFDYRPLLSFIPALIVTGMAFVAIGVMFSSFTSNQIVAAVFTFVAMFLMWLPYFRFLFKIRETSIWNDVLIYVSPLDLWQTSLYGILAPRYFLYFVSVTVFCLFLTCKALEARKWK
ncbi:MAG: ABC transporter permease [Gemmataceae bacterium]